MTVFLTTHYMEEAAKAQYVSIMEAGRIAAEGTPQELKGQYANDLLKLVPEDEDVLTQQLHESNLSYERKSNHIKVIIPDTMYALGVLNRIKDNIKSFEVVQGTMDDVFLNVTGKSL
jgi:multidrug/hemolysin transport system ATP-binding protein